MVLHKLSALVVAGMLSVFAVLLLTGNYASEGPILLRLIGDHGIHAGDVFVVLGWAAALAAEVSLLRPASREDG